MPSPTQQRARALVLPLLVAVLAAAGCERSADPGPSATSSAPRTDAQAPALVVVDPQSPDVPDEVDLGVLPFGEVQRRAVRLRNVSAAPLTLRSVKPGCSCTQTQVRYVDPASGKEVIGHTTGSGDVITLPPGVTAELEITVDTALAPTRNKPKLVIVRITTDSPATPFLTLSLRMFVESAFRPAPAVIDLRQVARNAGGVGEVGIAMDGEGGQRITEVLQSPLELVPQLQLLKVTGVDLWRLRVRLVPPVPLGFHSYEILLGTTGPDGQGEGPPLKVTVRATGVPDAGIDPPLVTLQVPPEGGAATGATRLVTRLPGQVLRVTSARAEGIGPRRIEVEAVPVEPDAQGRAADWDLRLHARDDLGPEPLQGTLVVETDDEQIPRLEGRWVWRP